MTVAGLGRAALPVVAIVAFVAIPGAIVAAAGSTFGYDFLAYHGAARRLLTGEAVYDLGYQQAGGFGLFLYPPTFLPIILPFGTVEPGVAAWAWLAVMVASLLAAIRLLPVPSSVRWVVLLLAALDWPVAYTLKLGQVTPLLLLLAVVGWRAVERPRSSIAGGRTEPPLPGSALTVPASGIALGVSAALGVAIKLQPALLLAWAVAARRWRAVAAGLAVLLAVAAIATLVAGPGAWLDYVRLIRQITDPVTTEHNVTPGWVARGLGLSVEAAGMVQLTATAAALAALAISIVVCLPAASYLVAVAVSQLISPVLWDHYAMLLLLPVAWLLARGARWATLIPLATSVPLVTITPLAAYPVLFAITVGALLAVGRPAPSGPSLSAATRG